MVQFEGRNFGLVDWMWGLGQREGEKQRPVPGFNTWVEQWCDLLRRAVFSMGWRGGREWNKQQQEFPFGHFKFMRWYPSRDNKEAAGAQR